MAAVAVRRMKRRSINVFTPVRRTRGVGHRRGEAGIFLRLRVELEA
jgi:hypothetical protein